VNLLARLALLVSILGLMVLVTWLLFRQDWIGPAFSALGGAAGVALVGWWQRRRNRTKSTDKSLMADERDRRGWPGSFSA
jgi:CHASE2 domain-containing sensor protein